MTEVSRAGHWKHEWVPLDVAAAMSKFHGRVPNGWFPPGQAKKTKTSHARHGENWMTLSNFRDSTETGTGYRTSDIGRVADFSATVHERAPSGWHKGAQKNFDWRVFRQRTEREGPDQHGSHWSGDYASGLEHDIQAAKRAALAAMKKHRAAHIAAGGDYGYGEESRRMQTWARRWAAGWFAGTSGG